MDKTLSILIPARNEMFLRETVVNLLQNIRGNTEILIGLDGEWADPPIPDDERVTIVFYGKSIGQRAITNQLCKLSKAKYVMKLDAHCVMDEGFDVKLMADIKDDWTVIPTLYNLHAFDWVCIGKNLKSGKKYLTKEELDPIRGCDNRIYQSPTPDKCSKCGGNMERELIFKPRFSRRSYFYRFDKTLHFQYWGDLGNRPEQQAEIAETMSAQGSCFMLTRQKYWELNICDEEHGSWGQQGTEVACKTWLSGGRLVTNKKTWYSHMFRTQGGDFGFPYPQSGRQVEKAREYSRNLFLNGNWDKAIYKLDWLLDKFKPVPDWHDVNSSEKSEKKLTKGVIYYTHGLGDPTILESCRKQLLKGIKEKHIISASNEPLKFGLQNIVIPFNNEIKYLDMFTKILKCLEASTADVIFFAEHDVLYHPKHFDFLPQDKEKYYYNTNVWRVRASDGHSLFCNDLQQLSGLVGYRETLIKHFKERIRRTQEAGGYSQAMGFEPGTHNRPERIDDLKAESYFAQFPNLDLRHDTNSTSSRWTKEEFRNEKYTEGWAEKNITEIEGWDITSNIFDFLKTI